MFRNPTSQESAMSEPYPGYPTSPPYADTIATPPLAPPVAPPPPPAAPAAPVPPERGGNRVLRFVAMLVVVGLIGLGVGAVVANGRTSTRAVTTRRAQPSRSASSPQPSQPVPTPSTGSSSKSG